VIYLKNLEMIAGWLLVLGGVDLGLQGLMGYGLFYMVFGSGMMLERLFDLAVGASAVWMAYSMLNAKKKKR
jgi:uncharacterized membrane protein YuzA (DUF378 family)